MTIAAAQKAMQEGRLEDARTHLEAAVRTTRAGPEIHYNLALVLSRLKDFGAAAESFEYCARHAPENPDILNNLANALRLSGQQERARQVFDKALEISPGHPALRCNRGWLYLSRGNSAAACGDFRAALNTDREIEDAWRGLAESLLAGGDAVQASSVARQALERFPKSSALHNLLGVACNRRQRPDKALPPLQEAVGLAPNNVDALTNLGVTAEQLGDLELAERSLKQALVVKPAHHPAWFHLANMAGWKPQGGEPEQLQRALAGAPDDIARIDLEFALAKTLAKLGRHVDAFPHLILARKSMAAGQAYDLEQAIAELEAAGRQSLQLQTAPAQRLFVVGMPRSGTTLVDQILASHTDVHSRGDSGIAARLQRAANQAGTPLGQWLREQMPLPQGAARVVDTSPGHFTQLGLLASLLPEARFIHCARHPLDTCVSIFEQPLTGGHGYANTLEGLGRYYRSYQSLMGRWQQLLGERLLTVQYEQLVRQPVEEITRLLAHCELPLEQGCLDFHQHQRAVLTPSASQVRQPVNDRSIGRWRRYQAFLQPLIAELPGELL